MVQKSTDVCYVLPGNNLLNRNGNKESSNKKCRENLLFVQSILVVVIFINIYRWERFFKGEKFQL